MWNELRTAFETLAEPVSRTLVHSLWQGGLIALLLGGAMFLLRRSSARVRYAICCLSMVAVVGTGVATGFYVAQSSVPATVEPQMAHQQPTPVDRGQAASAVDDAGVGTQAVGDVWDTRALRHWLFPLWVLGVFALSLYHLLGWRRVRRLTLNGTSEFPEIWAARLSELCRELKVSRPVRFATSTLIRVPCVIGWVKPVVLVPLSTLTGLAAADLELILAHELAHIRRYDVLLGYLQAIAETLLFFNPAVWWISRQVRIEREHCCDDLAIARGDRVRYVHALANLEEEREGKMSLVAAANGTSLIHRARRLLGRPAPRNTLPGVGVAGALLLAAFLVLGSGVAGNFTSDDVAVAAQHDDDFDRDEYDFRGKWELEIDGKHSHLTMRYDRNWINSTSIDLREFSTEIDENTTEFRMEREAGTFYFEGEFYERRNELLGDGKWHFRENPDYVKQMTKLGYKLNREKRALQLAVHDVTLQFTRGLHDRGYDHVKYDDLIAAHIHDVTPEFIDELADLGYRDLKMDELVSMQIHDATPEYIEEMKELGYENIDPDQLVSMRIHDVEPHDIHAFEQHGYHNIHADDLVSMNIHDVTPEYVEDLAELGYKDLTIDGLVSMKIHDVETDDIRFFASLGYEHISADDLVQMNIHDVTPQYVEQLAGLGHKHVSIDKLVQMKIHDVDTRDVRSFASLGYESISPEELVQMDIHDVTPRYVEELAELGHKNLSPEELVQMKIHDVDTRDIRQYADLGYDNLSAEELVQMNIHDVSPRYVEQLAGLGHRNLSPGELVQMKIHDVDTRDIREFAELGYDDISAEELVQMNIHDVTPRFVKQLAELGYKNIAIDELVQMQIHDVTASYIKRLQKRGIDDLSVEELIRRRIRGR